MFQPSVSKLVSHGQPADVIQRLRLLSAANTHSPLPVGMRRLNTV